MSVDGIRYSAKGTLIGTAGIEGISNPVQPKPGLQPVKFGDVLLDAIKETDKLEKIADKKVTDLMVSSTPQSPHDAMISLEKADLAFQLMNQVRSKIIRAYEDLMRTQV